MPKDIRKMLENYPEESVNLSSNHQNRFEKKLMRELHNEKPKPQTWKWLSIAASLAFLITLSVKFYSKEEDLNKVTTTTTDTNQFRQISLGNISPEYNTIEKYYTNSINLAISELDITEKNQEILDRYLNKIRELTNEYKTLTQELNTKGVNDQTIDALISNLQLRLQLLKRLKKQLNDLKELNSKQNEIT